MKATQTGDTEGTVIELVAAIDADSLNLLLSNRRETILGSRV